MIAVYYYRYKGVMVGRSERGYDVNKLGIVGVGFPELEGKRG